jgi:hypothetical protein
LEKVGIVTAEKLLIEIEDMSIDVWSQRDAELRLPNLAFNLYFLLAITVATNSALNTALYALTVKTH